MGRLTLFMHISLDGFAAGTNGQMDWIHVDDEIFDAGAQRIYATDCAVYGRKTYQLMESYWPTAADQPDPTRHDIEHSKWYRRVRKVVLSRSLKAENLVNTQIIRENLAAEINQLKQSTEKEILVFGSPTAGHALMVENLIDDYWFNINPVLLGDGIPVFKDLRTQTNLSLVATEVFTSGVISAHYTSKI
jgi:dihydrofolate reductase